MSKQKQKTIYVHNMFWACCFHARTGKSMNNLLSDCELVDARIRESNEDAPVMLTLFIALKYSEFRKFLVGGKFLPLSFQTEK